MGKRLWSVLLTLALLLTLFPTAALAEEPEEEAVEVQTETVTLEDEDWDSDVLFSLYVDQLFGFEVPSIFSTGDEAAYNRLKEDERTAYSDVYAGIQELLDSSNSRTSTEFRATVSLENSSWDRVYDALLKYHPYEMFWRALSYSRGGNYLGIHVSVNYSQGGGKETFTIDKGKVKSAAESKENADKIVVEANKKSSVYEKLKFLNDEICRLTEYNFAALNLPQGTYGDPWQLIYVFDGDTTTNVVCEGYSKAFQYLCDNVFPNGSNGVQCYTVTGQMAGGTGSGGHMWNIVSINGTSYLVDVTNCDGNSIGAPYELFLVGTDGTTPGVWSSTTEGDISSDVTIKIGNTAIHYLYDEDLLWPNTVLNLSETDYKPTGAPDSVTVTCDTPQDTGVTDSTTIKGFHKPEFLES